MEDAVDEVLEYGVRGHEERPEDQQREKGKRRATQHRQTASGPTTRRLLPFRFSKKKKEDSKRCVDSRNDATQSIFHQAGNPQPPSLGAQYRERQRRQQRQQVERLESERFVPKEGQGREHNRQQKPPTAFGKNLATPAPQQKDGRR